MHHNKLCYMVLLVPRFQGYRTEGRVSQFYKQNLLTINEQKVSQVTATKQANNATKSEVTTVSSSV